MDVEIRLRTGETPAGVAQAAFTLLTSGQDIALAPYFQVQVDFQRNHPGLGGGRPRGGG